MRQQNVELARGLSEVKLELAVKDAKLDELETVLGAKDQPWWETVLRSTVMDVVYVVLGILVGASAVDYAR